MVIIFSLILAVVGVGGFIAVLFLLFTDKAVVIGSILARRNLERAEFEGRDLFLTANPVTLLWANLAALILLSVVAQVFIESAVVTMSVAGITLLAPGIFWARARKKRFRMIEAQLPDAFMMLGSSLQSGASILVAVQTVAEQSPVPFAQELRLVVRKTQVGVSIDDALRQMEQRVPVDSLIMASSAVRISREVGGNLVETIFGIAETLRRKFTMEGKIESLTAQGKAQGKFMGALPILVGVGLWFMDPISMNKLFETGIGNVVLGVIITMQVLGFIGINKVTNIDS